MAAALSYRLALGGFGSAALRREPHGFMMPRVADARRLSTIFD